MANLSRLCPKGSLTSGRAALEAHDYSDQCHNSPRDCNSQQMRVAPSPTFWSPCYFLRVDLPPYLRAARLSRAATRRCAEADTTSARKPCPTEAVGRSEQPIRGNVVQTSPQIQLLPLESRATPFTQGPLTAPRHVQRLRYGTVGAPHVKVSKFSVRTFPHRTRTTGAACRSCGS